MGDSPHHSKIREWCRAPTAIFYRATSGILLTAIQESLFQSFQWFDRLTMSGLILNRFAPFKPLSRETDKIPLLRDARSVPLPALAVQGEETLRSARAELSQPVSRLTVAR